MSRTRKGVVLAVFMLVAASLVIAAAQNPSDHPSPTDVMRGVIKAIGSAQAVEYEVTIPPGYDVYGVPGKVRGHSKIVLADNPLRAVATFVGDNDAVYELSVIEGNILRLSVAGKVSQHDLSRGVPPLSAQGDVNVTRGLLLSPAYYEAAITSGNLLYGGQDDLDGDLCHVIIHVMNNPALSEITTNYYWISTRTNLPRAVQAFRLIKGRQFLTSKRVFSNIKYNPELKPEMFAYKPAAGDSVPFPTEAAATPTAGTETDAAVAETARKLIGNPVPNASVQDLEYKSLRFSQLTGQPTVITFWATWCGPCIEEMPTFTRLVDEYKGRLRVLAVATMDTRIDSVNFIQKHPDFKFTYLLDPDWETKNSRLVQAFGIAGLPTNLFIDASGKVIDYWRGLEGDQALEKKIRQLMGR